MRGPLNRGPLKIPTSLQSERPPEKRDRRCCLGPSPSQISTLISISIYISICPSPSLSPSLSLYLSLSLNIYIYIYIYIHLCHRYARALRAGSPAGSPRHVLFWLLEALARPTYIYIYIYYLFMIIHIYIYIYIYIY